MSVWSDRSMIFITKIKLKVCPPRYHSTGSLQLIQLWLLLMHSHTEHEKGETINYLLTTASVLLEKEHCWAGYWPGHSNIDTDYCSSSTSIHSIHCCGREEGGSFVFNRPIGQTHISDAHDTLVQWMLFLYICLFKLLMFSHIDHRGEAVK